MLKNLIRLPLTVTCVAIRALSETALVQRESNRVADAWNNWAPVKELKEALRDLKKASDDLNMHATTIVDGVRTKPWSSL